MGGGRRRAKGSRGSQLEEFRVGESLNRDAAPDLLHYRLWRGEYRAAGASVWPIARSSLQMIFRRRLFWGLYALGMLIFLLFFFGQYLFAWAETQTSEESVRIGNFGRANPADLVRILRESLKLNGSAETYRNFINYQGHIVMIVLALAGAILIGNDLRFGTLPFYLSKPISRWHYLLGKALAVAVFINLMTTIPAEALFIQYGVLESWDYFRTSARLFFGILGYGAVQTVSLCLILLATATWLRKTVPLVMTWTTLFFFCRLLANALVDGLHFDPRWRLIDLWNDTGLIGSACLGFNQLPTEQLPTNQPAWTLAALVLVGVNAACLTYLVARLRAVEIVR
jgi:ABC-type transport system involved in multi-copper enzyme maturation permease subunit